MWYGQICESCYIKDHSLLKMKLNKGTLLKI